MEKFTLVSGDWNRLGWDAGVIRREVFVKEQQIPEEEEWDDADKDCLHVVAYDPAGEPLATGRLLSTGFIGRMAVLYRARGKGIGGQILELLTSEAGRAGHSYACLNAQKRVLSFYEAHGRGWAGVSRGLTLCTSRCGELRDDAVRDSGLS
ncbi:MAG: GNAT family N-acetyltransferase [Bryobacteraceae bacterium]